MGCNQSLLPRLTSKRRSERESANDVIVQNDPQQQQQRQQQRNNRRENNKKMKSLVRVGSTMIKSVMIRDPNSGRVTKVRRATNERAETYDHVHHVVNETLEEAHQSSSHEADAHHHKKQQHAGNGAGGGGILKNPLVTVANEISRAAKPVATGTHTGGGGGARRTVGTVGLRNLGNTCFMNSSLQCLTHTIPLTDYFLGYDYKKEINYENFLGTKGELANAYAKLMKEMWLGKKKSLAPSAFKSHLGHFAPQFAGYNQHDCQELLAFLLDGIHEDLNRVKKRPYIEDKDCDGTNDAADAMDAWQNYLKRNKSIVVDLFQGQLRNTMTCRNAKKKRSDGSPGCGHKNVKFEPFMYLSLPIQDSCKTLDDCLELFCTMEHLTGNDQWYCPKCKDHVNATKKFDLWMLPPILVVHLKRFRYNDHGVRSKLDRKMKYPVCNWSLSKFIKSSEEENDKNEKYDLYAITNHYGGLGGGHYTAHAMNRFDNQWYEFNDATCTKIDQSSLGNDKAAYCLFYNRMELENEEEEDSFRRAVVRRQSVSRPELWPHMQNAAATKNHNNEAKVDLRSSFRHFHKVSKANVAQLDDTLVVEEEGSDEDMEEEKETANIVPLQEVLEEEESSDEVLEKEAGSADKGIKKDNDVDKVPEKEENTNDDNKGKEGNR